MHRHDAQNVVGKVEVSVARLGGQKDAFLRLLLAAVTARVTNGDATWSRSEAEPCG